VCAVRVCIDNAVRSGSARKHACRAAPGQAWMGRILPRVSHERQHVLQIVQVRGPQDNNLDTGGEFNNERHHPLPTNFRRPEKQGSFLCRSRVSIGESRVERIRHQCQSSGQHCRIMKKDHR
jgi:hypothetical protein